MSTVKIIKATPDNIHEFGMCGYKNLKMEGYRRKIAWTKERFKEGMNYNVLWSEEKGAVGAIEYIPGDFAWRPVIAPGYMFIHCIFILPKNMKGKGYGQMLIDSSIEDAKKQNMKGVATVVRKGTWMAGKDLFIKNGFEVADKAKPDFELLYKAFSTHAEKPLFFSKWDAKLKKYGSGLIIFSSDQCPYTAKAIGEIYETAKNEYRIKPEIVKFANYKEAQESPCAFGTFCILFRGKVIAEHPISNTRFKNIMNKVI